MYPLRITGDLSSRYLFYFLLSEPFVRLMVDESMRVAMPKVNRETLSACRMIVPAKEEQDAIAALLDVETQKIDRLVARIREHIAKLKEYHIALISAAVT